MSAFVSLDYAVSNEHAASQREMCRLTATMHNFSVGGVPQCCTMVVRDVRLSWLLGHSLRNGSVTKQVQCPLVD